MPELLIELTERTLSGCEGRSCIGHNGSRSAVQWDGAVETPADSWAIDVTLSLYCGRDLIDSLHVDGDVWRQLEEDGDAVEGFARDACSSRRLEFALRAQVDWMTNSYSHASCGTAWTDSHSCACDDECPSCGAAVSPNDSEVHRRLSDEVPARLERQSRRQLRLRSQPFLVFSASGVSVHTDGEKAMAQAIREGGHRVPLIADCDSTRGCAYMVVCAHGDQALLKEQRALAIAQEHHGECVPLIPDPHWLAQQRVEAVAEPLRCARPRG